MIIETEEKDVRHPEGKIQLKNGNVLDCYPITDQPGVIVRDNLSLDTTGEFLQVGKSRGKRLSGKRIPERPAWEQLFLQEAFYLYEHKEQILSDSRMFLTPLPFKNGLAYTGPSGMNNATLGVYLEWWEDCEQAVIRDKDQVDAFTYFIAGSPLSGANHCLAVDRKGRSVTMQFSPFLPIWSSFMRINQRYTEANQRYQSYTLEDTIAKLRKA